MIPFVKTMLAGMFKRNVTVKYPFRPKINDPLVRGHIGIEIEKCIYCGLCKRKCPTDAIEVSKAEQMWEIERFNCIQCAGCAEVCPKKCLHMNNVLTPASTEKIKDRVELKDARISDNGGDN